MVVHSNRLEAITRVGICAFFRILELDSLIQWLHWLN